MHLGLNSFWRRQGGPPQDRFPGGGLRWAVGAFHPAL